MTPSDISALCGYVRNEAERDRIAAMQPHPCFADAAGAIRGSGKGLDVFLWQIEESVTGKPVRDPHEQTIGDCVSHGSSGGCEDLQYVQIDNEKKDGSATIGEFNMIATEVMYAGSRVEIGKGGCGRGDGSVVGWAIQFAKQYGIVPRGKFGRYDLSVYDGQTARQWGMPNAGVPSELEEVAKKAPLLQATLVEGPDYYNQAIDALANKMLIVTGSNQLFGQSRGSDGFIDPHGHGGHCTYYRGFTDNPKRPGIFYQNSWGKNYHVGPQTVTLPGRDKQVILPYGGGFVDAEVFNQMHRGDEVWAIGAMTDFNPQPAPNPVYVIAFY